MSEDSRPIMVSIQCLVYNHEPYIRQCLDGFVAQKTNFRFEAIVHDDASTDGSAGIIKEYAEKYPDIIKPVLESENQYKKHDGSLRKIVMEHLKGKYIALCEGDDYWIDPMKLQKQVNYMEAHPECTMTCNRTKLFSEQQQKYIGENYCSDEDGYLSTKEIILRGGLYISTCSILYRESILEKGYPEYCKQCHVGDYPLQIYAAMKGKVYYFNDIMSVYRVENSASWIGQRKAIDIEKRISTVSSEVRMLEGFAIDYPEYGSFFKQRIGAYINKNFPDRKNSIVDQNKYLYTFAKEIADYSLFGKLDLLIRRIRLKGVMRFYPYRKQNKYRQKIKKYE